MGRSVTFLHVADVHLGAPMRGFRALTDEWAARLARAIPESLDRVIDAALAHEVDFVVLAGDAFDTSRASYAEYLRFFEALGRLDAAGIPVYLVAGNHDPYTSWAGDIDRLPASARMLGVEGPEFALFSKGDAPDAPDEPLCLIGGRSYYNQTWPSDRGIADGITRAAAEKALGVEPGQVPFAIGIIHTGLDIDASKAATDERMLLEADVDYWACGHLHQRLVRPRAASPRVVFPGCIQGRDAKETGERGCYLVTLEEDAPPTLEFVPTSSVVLEKVHVDVSICRTLGDLANHVATALFRENSGTHCDDMVACVVLEGETELHRFLVKPEVIADVRKQINDAYPSFYCDALIDRTRERLRDAQIGSKAPGSESSLFGSVLAEIAEEQASREETMINYIQSEFVKRGIAVPASLSRRVGIFNDAAEQLVFDLLREEDE